ncbi:retrovirus-related pol polyprotein from transposon TNT 1-94 [Tanacetum coccineum]
MMLDSIDNASLVYPNVEEDGQTQPKKYLELTEAEQLQDDYDVQETNIILQGLPPDVYALINHQEAAKDIWDKVKLLMKGTKLSYQERECRLYNLFDKFASVQVTQQPQDEFPQLDSGLAVPTFHQEEDPIDYINKAMAFLFAVASRNYYNLKGNYAASQPGVVKCYNCQGEGQMARQCTQPKRPRNSTWFKEKFMLVEAQEAGQILDEEQLAFITDPGIEKAQVA